MRARATACIVGSTMLHASERKALTLATFVASCIAFAPGQVVSGAVLLVASVLLWRWDAGHRARERATTPDHEDAG